MGMGGVLGKEGSALRKGEVSRAWSEVSLGKGGVSWQMRKCPAQEGSVPGKEEVSWPWGKCPRLGGGGVSWARGLVSWARRNWASTISEFHSQKASSNFNFFPVLNCVIEPLRTKLNCLSVSPFIICLARERAR